MGGLPFDITYAGLIDFAKDGDTEGVAKTQEAHVMSYIGLVISAIGTIFGVVANIVWQGMLWSADF